MVKTLQKHGNSHALVFDKTLMETLGIEPNTPLQVTVVGGSLVISPANVGLGREAVDDFLRRARPRYSGMLKRLAE